MTENTRLLLLDHAELKTGEILRVDSLPDGQLLQFIDKMKPPLLPTAGSALK